MAVHIESPGVIIQAGGSRKLIFGRDPQDAPGLEPLAELMTGAGINVELVEDIRLPVWSKYIMICPLAAATSWRSSRELLSAWEWRQVWILRCTALYTRLFGRGKRLEGVLSTILHNAVDKLLQCQ